MTPRHRRVRHCLDPLCRVLTVMEQFPRPRRGAASKTIACSGSGARGRAASPISPPREVEFSAFALSPPILGNDRSTGPHRVATAKREPSLGPKKTTTTRSPSWQHPPTSTTTGPPPPAARQTEYTAALGEEQRGARWREGMVRGFARKPIRFEGC